MRRPWRDLANGAVSLPIALCVTASTAVAPPNDRMDIRPHGERAVANSTLVGVRRLTIPICESPDPVEDGGVNLNQCRESEMAAEPARRWCGVVAAAGVAARSDVATGIATGAAAGAEQERGIVEDARGGVEQREECCRSVTGKYKG